MKETQEESSQSSPFFFSFISRSLVLSALTDIALFILLILEFRNTCDIPLRSWTILAISLGFPCSYLICCLKKFHLAAAQYGEVFFFITSFFWNCVGGYWIFSAKTCARTSPLLYWAVYAGQIFICVFVSLMIVTVLVITVITTIGSSISSSKQKGEMEVEEELGNA